MASDEKARRAEQGQYRDVWRGHRHSTIVVMRWKPPISTNGGIRDAPMILSAEWAQATEIIGLGESRELFGR